MPRIQLGDVYLISTPPNGSHFYVAIMSLESDHYLFVNYSTVQDSTPEKDLDFTLSPSPSLPFIDRESYFVFSKARELNNSDIDMLISKDECCKKGAFQYPILEKIQLAGCVSKSLKNKYRNQLRGLLNC